MGRFFKTSLPEFTDKPVLSTAPLELIAATQTAVVDKQAKTLEYGTTLINMLAQMPHMKEHDPIIKEKLDEVTKELQGLYQEMDKNPMSSHQTLQKALLYGQDLVKELTTGDFKTITDSYNTNNKGLTTNQKILADDYYAQPTYQASRRKYAANMYDDEGRLKPYEFPYLAPTPDLLGKLATMALSIPKMGRIESGAGGSYDMIEERSEQDILQYFYDNPTMIKQIIDPQLKAVQAQKGYYEDDNLAEEYAANYNYENAIIYDPETNQYSINEDIKGKTLGNALQFALSQRDRDITRHSPSGGSVSTSRKGKVGNTPTGLGENPDGTVVAPVKTSYQNLDSNPDMLHKNDYNENISTKYSTVTTEKTKRPTNIEMQKVQVMTIANALYNTYVIERKQDPQLFWNLVASVAHEYLDRNGKAFDELMASFKKDELLTADKSKIQKATLVPTHNPYFDNYDLLSRIRFNALGEGMRNHYGELYRGEILAPDGKRFSAADMDKFVSSQLFAPITSFFPTDSFEGWLYALEKNTGQLGTTFRDEYTKTSSSLVPTFNLPVNEYPVALKGEFTEAEVANMNKSSIIINRRINEAKELSDAKIWDSLFTNEGIKKAKPIISYRGCDSNGTAQYFATIKDEDGTSHVFELSDKDGLISKIYGWDFTDIATAPFFDIDNKSQTEALVALWTSKLKEKNGQVSRITYNAFIEKAADTEKAKAESYIAEQVLDAEDMRRRYSIPEDKLLSADFIKNNTGTKLKDVSDNKEFEKAAIITKEVEYKGFTQEINIVFDEKYTPYSIIVTPEGEVHVTQLSSAFNNQIEEEARRKVRRIYDIADLNAQK